MTRTKYLKGECRECHGHIEFPVEAAGMTIDCPHCGKPTDLVLAKLPEEPLLPRRTIVWTMVAVVIVGLGVAGALVALKLAQKKMAQKQEAAAKALAAVHKSSEPKSPPPPPPDDPALNAGFRVTRITLEKTQGSSLTYAIGTLINTTNRQRFGVKIELDLLDTAGAKVGTATDYQQVIEPNGRWPFKALCVESKAESAKLASIKEDQ